MSPTAPLPFGDHPIDEPGQDVLGRNPLADALGEELNRVDVSRGAVAAITGAWGSGKTSLMNLTAKRLGGMTGIRLIEFNPWLFSGAEELAGAFLGELAAQLRDLESRGDRARRVAAEVADSVGQYATALSALRFIPGVGPVQDSIEAAAKQGAAVLRGETSLAAQRSAALAALRNLDGRIIVLVDDIDRLTRTEIRDLFRTVRLTASFPNVVYLMCLDREVIEKALDEEGFSGRAYLESYRKLGSLPASPQVSGVMARVSDKTP